MSPFPLLSFRRFLRYHTHIVLYRAIYLIPVYICFMGGVTYIHTKTSLVTKYCNTTDQVIISGKTKRHLMQPLWLWAYHTISYQIIPYHIIPYHIIPHLTLTLSPSRPQSKLLKPHWAAQLSVERGGEGTVTHSVT